MFRESSTPHTRADSRNATSDLPTSASLASACHRVLLSRPRESQVIYRALVCLAHSTCEWRPPDGTACTAVYPLCRPAHEATMMSLRASSRSYHALVASHHLLPIPLQCAQPLPARARHSVVRFHLAITKNGPPNRRRTDGLNGKKITRVRPSLGLGKLIGHSPQEDAALGAHRDDALLVG